MLAHSVYASRLRERQRAQTDVCDCPCTLPRPRRGACRLVIAVMALVAVTVCTVTAFVSLGRSRDRDAHFHVLGQPNDKHWQRGVNVVGNGVNNDRPVVDPLNSVPSRSAVPRRSLEPSVQSARVTGEGTDLLRSALRALASSAASLQSRLDNVRASNASIDAQISQGNIHPRSADGMSKAVEGVALASPPPSSVGANAVPPPANTRAGAAAPNKDEGNRHVHAVHDATDPKTARRLLIYRGALRGQGMGNSLNGLWVAHLLARQHNRTVCVKWTAFENAFVLADSAAAAACDFALKSQADEMEEAPLVQSWNFAQTDSPKRINDVIGGSSHVVKFDGNEWLTSQWPDEPMSPFLAACVLTF